MHNYLGYFPQFGWLILQTLLFPWPKFVSIIPVITGLKNCDTHEFYMQPQVHIIIIIVIIIITTIVIDSDSKKGEDEKVV